MKLLITTFLFIAFIGAIAYHFISDSQESKVYESSIPLSGSELIVTPQKNSVYFDISPTTACTNECSDYRNNAEQYDYCRNICGFTSEEGENQSSTSANPTLSNDYILKEEAIRERDLKKCFLIGDTNIRVSCQTRVTEDLLEE